MAHDDQAHALARIDGIQLLGSQNLVHLRVLGRNSESPLTALVSSEYSVSPNDRVGVLFATEHLHLFDAETGSRLN